MVFVIGYYRKDNLGWKEMDFMGNFIEIIIWKLLEVFGILNINDSIGEVFFIYSIFR